MQKRHSTVFKALAGLAFGLALTATSVQAQTQVCVRNMSGYAAKIQVKWTAGIYQDLPYRDFKWDAGQTAQTDEFGLKNSRCITLQGVVPKPGIPAEVDYYVEVKVGGRSELMRCPTQKYSGGNYTLFFDLADTVFKPSCKLTV